MNYGNEDVRTLSFMKGKKMPGSILELDEQETIREHCDASEVDFQGVKFYARAHIRGQNYTSSRYIKQRKRCNYNIYWQAAGEDVIKFGIVKLFLQINGQIFVLARELVPCINLNAVSNAQIRFSNIHTLIRESCCLHILSEKEIKGKIIRIRDYVCIPRHIGKKWKLQIWKFVKYIAVFFCVEGTILSVNVN